MNTYTKEQLIKKAVKFSTTKELENRRMSSFKSAFCQIFLTAKAINEKNASIFEIQNELLNSLIECNKFDNLAYIEKKIYNKRFTNKRYIKVK